MSYVVAESCTDCGACIPACPRAAIHPSVFGPVPLTVDPLACNDCDSCARVCPEHAIAADPEWPICRGRGCPLTSRRYSCWACTESRIRCLECGGPLWKGPDDGLWRCPACEIEGRVSCPKLRKHRAGNRDSLQTLGT
ncbi:MAG: 4Fe-4S binding protein [Acidimicrobiia bacterium]|nr:4Fe-4S binding protein [Acidimicrobiia bacterium]